jgi:hypothetical protein
MNEYTNIDTLIGHDLQPVHHLDRLLLLLLTCTDLLFYKGLPVQVSNTFSRFALSNYMTAIEGRQQEEHSLFHAVVDIAFMIWISGSVTVLNVCQVSHSFSSKL